MNYEKTFWTIMLVFFFIFISIFIASENGYYEYENRNKTIFTEEKIKEFENDVKEGKNIDLKDYLKEENEDYSNKITDIGNITSNVLSGGILKGLEKSFSFFEKMLN